MMVNWPILFIAFFYLTVETIYFGVNFIPVSSAEIIADGIGLFMIALSIRNRPQRPNHTVEEPK